MNILAYCDGACDPNPGPGSHAAVILIPDQPIIEHVSKVRTRSTNNIEELSGAIAVLDLLIRRNVQGNLVIRSDSQYVVKGITHWIDNWKTKNWVTRNRTPVANAEFWKKLDQFKQQWITQYGTLHFDWVRGHHGDVYNERCDTLAAQVLEHYHRTGDISLPAPITLSVARTDVTKTDLFPWE